MANDPQWPHEPGEAYAATGMRGGDPVRPGLPPPMPPALAPQLDYARPGTAKSDRDFPVAAGFAIGFGLYLAVAGVWWMVARAGGGLGFALCGLAGVPVAAHVLAAILHLSFGWRGLGRGVSTAFMLTILIGGFGIAALCGRW